MEETMMLAGVWGPAMVAMGLGIFISRNHYIRVYREIEREPMAVLVFGIAAVVLGMWQVNVHDVWDTFPEMLISLLGWALLLKGLAAMIMPKWLDRGGNWVVSNQQMLSFVGGAVLLLGVYLTWFAYYA